MPEPPRHRHLRGAELIDFRKQIVHARQAALCGASEGGTSRRSEVTCERCKEIIRQRVRDGKKAGR